MMRWLRRLWLRKQQKLQAVRTAEGIGAALGGSSSSAALETQAAMLPCSTGQAARLPCCRLDHGRLDVHSSSLRLTEKS